MIWPHYSIRTGTRGKDSPHLRFVNENRSKFDASAARAGGGDGAGVELGAVHPGRERARGNALERPMRGSAGSGARGVARDSSQSGATRGGFERGQP